jgi:hypothetical protein
MSLLLPRRRRRPPPPRRRKNFALWRDRLSCKDSAPRP